MKVKILILIGGIILLCQVFKPIDTIVNDNILRNSNLKQKENGSTLYWSASIGNIQYYNNDFDAFIAVPNPTTYEVNITDSNQFEGVGRGGLVLSCQAAFETSNITAANIWGDCMVETIIGGAAQGGYSEISSKTVNNNTIDIVFKLSGLNFEDLMKVHIASLNLKSSLPFKVIKLKLETGYIATPYCPSIYDNVKWNYDQYNASFQRANAGYIKPESYEYTKNLDDVGTFTMFVSRSQKVLKDIKPDYMLCYDGDFLLVEDINYDFPIPTITGCDLKGLLKSRITLGTITNGSMSYYSVTGSTEYCLKKLILDSIVNPIDSGDKIPLVTLTENKDRGLASDSIKSRFEQDDIVVKNLCSNANIGYDMKADLINNKILFDVIDVVDKSAEQLDRNRVIFDLNKRNVSSYKRSIGNSTSKTYFYGTSSIGNADQNTTFKTCYSGDTVPTGLKRKTKYLSVNVDSETEIVPKIKQEMHNYSDIDSIELQPADANMYGKVYQLGDKVTLKDDNVYTHEVINSATKRISKTEKTIILGFGNKKPQPLAYLKLQTKEAKI